MCSHSFTTYYHYSHLTHFCAAGPSLNQIHHHTLRRTEVYHSSVDCIQSVFAMMVTCQSSSYSLLLVAFLISLPRGLCASCFFPDGTPALIDIPCNTSARVSVCCGVGYACLDNNLCALTDDTRDPNNGEFDYIRGSCTDATWSSGSCPIFCTGMGGAQSGATEVLNISRYCTLADAMQVTPRAVMLSFRVD
jgi:hypothetical protein